MPVARPETSDARVIAHVDMDCFYVQGLFYLSSPNCIQSLYTLSERSNMDYYKGFPISGKGFCLFLIGCVKVVSFYYMISGATEATGVARTSYCGCTVQ